MPVVGPVGGKSPCQITLSNQPLIDPLLPLVWTSVMWKAAQPMMW